MVLDWTYHSKSDLCHFPSVLVTSFLRPTSVIIFPEQSGGVQACSYLPVSVPFPKWLSGMWPPFLFPVLIFQE